MFNHSSRPHCALSPSLASTRRERLHLGSSDSQDARKRMTVEKQKWCERCREWQDHYYWEHMDATKVRFFKFMTGDFAEAISIPEKFVKNFNGKITKDIDLKAPSGETWHVGVDKNADEMFLKAGWEDFVKAHELQENDLLIFTCSGDSSFEILIFEASGCEKVSSLFANRTSPNMHKYLDGMADGDQHAKNYSLSGSKYITTPSQIVGSPQDATTSQKSSGKKPRMLPESPNSANDLVKGAAIGEEFSDEEHSNSNYYYSMSANRLSDEEKEDIISLASIQSDNPAFFVVLQMSHVRRNNFLIFPHHFVADHLDRRLHEITLRRPNRKDKWCVKYYRACDSRGIRNYNFSKFVRENKLREGDICAFELMKGARRVTMTVHVMRKIDDMFVLVD